jgi:uncharacterized membrane protein
MCRTEINQLIQNNVQIAIERARIQRRIMSDLDDIVYYFLKDDIKSVDYRINNGLIQAALEIDNFDQFVETLNEKRPSVIIKNSEDIDNKKLITLSYLD